MGYGIKHRNLISKKKINIVNFFKKLKIKIRWQYCFMKTLGKNMKAHKKAQMRHLLHNA